MIINASYQGAGVGTGVYTDNILDALPEARTLRLPQKLMRPTAASFWSRRAAEVGLSAWRARVIHPYWATDLSGRHIVSVLDFVQYSEATHAERWALKGAALHAQAVLVLSEHVARQLEWRKPTSIFVAPPFPDRAWYETPTSPPPERGPRLRVGYFGGWHHRKAMPEFLTTLARSRLASEVEVHCTGVSPVEAPRGVSLIQHGRLTTLQAVALADTCSVSVYPSTDEGYGLPIAESLLRCRPVVCRDLDVYHEFTEPGALHVPASWSDPDALADAIDRAVAAPAAEPLATLTLPSRSESVAVLREALMQAVTTV